MTCPCGSQRTYEDCCGVFHHSKKAPETAETLMRSRYSAFVKGEIDYLRETTWPAYQKQFDRSGYQNRAENSIWLGLAILETSDGGRKDSIGTVTFTATSMVKTQLIKQTEKSLFKKKNGRWYYVKPVE